jgi:hypothetical protein
MGLFKKTPKATRVNTMLEHDPKGISAPPRQAIFQGTLADIKATPKTDKSVPDSRLEDLNRKPFF